MLDLQQGIQLMWTGYYPMEQSYDLSLDAGLLLYEMDKFEEALVYLERSKHINTEEPLASVLYSMAICNYELGAEGAALEYARRALAVEPDNEVVLELITALSEE
jgi:tetratricopeptide (TPR) repeat protein